MMLKMIAKTEGNISMSVSFDLIIWNVKSVVWLIHWSKKILVYEEDIKIQHQPSGLFTMTLRMCSVERFGEEEVGRQTL